MTDLITDAMVETAAIALRNQTRERLGLSPLDRLPWSPTSGEARADARAALEAAAPAIAAKAWDEGYQACRNRPRVDGYLINRANPYQTRADAIERGES